MICAEHASGVSGGGAVMCWSGGERSRGVFGAGGKHIPKWARVRAKYRRSTVVARERVRRTSRMRLRGLGRRGGGPGGGTRTHLRRRGRPRPGYFFAIRGIAGVAREVGSVVARGRDASRCRPRERVCRNVARRGAEVHLAVDVDATGGGLDARGVASSLALERRGSASGLHVDETERGRRGRARYPRRHVGGSQPQALINGRRGKKCVRVRVNAHDLVRTSSCRFRVRGRNASGYLDSRRRRAARREVPSRRERRRTGKRIKCSNLRARRVP